MDEGSKERIKSRRLNNEWWSTPNRQIIQKEFNRTIANLYLVGVFK